MRAAACRSVAPGGACPWCGDISRVRVSGRVRCFSFPRIFASPARPSLPPPSEKTPNNSEIICCDIPSDVVRALDDGHDCIPCQNVSPKSLRTPVLLRRPVLIRANNSSDRRRCGRCCLGAFFPIFPVGGGNFPSPKSEKAFEMTVSSDSFRGMRHFSKISCLENTIHYAN